MNYESLLITTTVFIVLSFEFQVCEMTLMYCTSFTLNQWRKNKNKFKKK